MGLEVCWGGRMKAALESSRVRKGNSCDHLWKEERRIYTHWVEEKEPGDGQQKTAHFHSFYFENIIVLFKRNQEWVHTV